MENHERWMEEAAVSAQKALCTRAKCGAVVVGDGQIIGRGYNAPPHDDLASAKCSFEYEADQRKPKSDRTCCMHAEWRAVLEALQTHPKQIVGSTLYFCRIDQNGKIEFSGEPYCTECSRLALDVGIAYFALWHESGIHLYDTVDYNNRSYEFHSRKF